MNSSLSRTPPIADLFRRSRTGRQVATFAAIGVASTLGYVILYATLRSVASAQVANLVALATTAVANTAANRRLTFGVRGRAGFVADQLAGLGAFGIALGITTGAIGLLEALAPRASLALEVLVVIAANALATIVRFLVLRSWMDRARRVADAPRVLPEGASR